MRRISLAASVALIVAVTLVPFDALQTDRAPATWCLVCDGLWLTDAISNIVLFVPLGVSLSLLGVTWTREPGLPFIRITDLAYNSRTRRMVAATYGRGLWAFDFSPATAVLRGDVNGDGVVNAADALIKSIYIIDSAPDFRCVVF